MSLPLKTPNPGCIYSRGLVFLKDTVLEAVLEPGTPESAAKLDLESPTARAGLVFLGDTVLVLLPAKPFRFVQ